MDRDRFPIDPWRLVERIYSEDRLGLAETIFTVANGYLGMRGNSSEGRNAHEHGTFVNGLHEVWPIRHAEQAYGFAEVGQTIVNAPDTKIIRLYVDDEPLVLDIAELLKYERALDFRDGVLRRELLWLTPAGKRVRVRSDRMVSFVERHLAVMSFEVVVENADANVVISSQVLNRQDGEDEFALPEQDGGKALAGFDPRRAERLADRVLQPVEHWQTGTRSGLGYRVTHSHMTLSVMVDHVLETDNDSRTTGSVGPDSAKHEFHVRARAGVPVRLTKFAAYHTSRSVPPRELLDRGDRLLDRAIETGAVAQHRAQRDWLTDFWEKSDVEIVGQPELQQATRWNLFMLAQAAGRADGQGVPAKGVTGSGYSGHYFWDTEVYVMPFLTYTNPLFGRNALLMRQRMLPAARRRARQLNEGGALFPWRTISGEEASAYYAAGTAQYHINADITYAIAKYVRATGDADFLARGAIDVVVETARLWTTLGFWRRTGGATFHIHGVTGPDEYTTVVNDNLFTNVMARFNLRYAAESVRIVADQFPEAYARMVDRVGFDEAEIGEWERAAEAMVIPFSESFGIHPQDVHFLDREVWDLKATPPDKLPLLLHFHPLVIYRFQVLKQADVVLALFLLSDEFSDEMKRADFEYYDPLTTGDSTLSAVVQSIIAAEIGYRDLALEYFHHAAFVDLDDLHNNASDGVHVASTGGVWSALVYGFGGMRDAGGHLTFDPRLPADWPELRFRIQWHGSRLKVTVSATELVAQVLSGDPVEFTVRGQRVSVAAGLPARVPLVGQGPLLHGRPSADRLSATRRDDGSLMTATVPIVGGDEWSTSGTDPAS
ncbi:glycosyl hydrolase family 65 protein [Amnibacterium sp. CER49]|uniref:glycoside hydrolase family 65 protein n=1 Tax=Amnibacterium sp. CER49 TaxID=3039161 RepID=UPI00244B4A8E|nr:glycosyl hydrolase family 65 protein [Amnibacterium sp. CER49]MDH2443796.1 glycosyl hydrolase family 65 protein [Amnibacterium sp. CER49]